MTGRKLRSNDTAPNAPQAPRPWLPFSVVVGAAILNLLDTSVTNIAAPSIEADLGGGNSFMQWLGSAYTLSLAAGLLVGGRLGDMFGRRAVYCAGMAGFVTASLICGLAMSPAMLVAARVLQGLSAAIVLPQSLGVIRTVFPVEKLSKAFAIYGPLTSLATLIGPVLAGVLVSADLFGWGWRSVFFVNVPIGIVLLAAGWLLLPTGRQSSVSSLDGLGALIAASAAVLLVYPLVEGRESGWPLWTWLSIGCALALFVVFARVQQRRDLRGHATLVAASLFRSRVFTGGLVLAAAVFSSMIGTGLVTAVFLQRSLGLSAISAALIVLPQAVGNLSGFFVANSKMLDRMGRGTLRLGIAIMILGILCLFATLHLTTITPENVWLLSPCLAVYGAGMGIFLSRFFTTVLTNVKPHEYGSASGTLNSVQQFSGSLGVAVLGTIYFATLGHSAPVAALTVTLLATLAFLTAAACAVSLLPKSRAAEHFLAPTARVIPTNAMTPINRRRTP
ncbi:MFS transporter [Enemella evansiae]|nr:MFS transporter [Enemella evansiae]